MPVATSTKPTAQVSNGVVGVAAAFAKQGADQIVPALVFLQSYAIFIASYIKTVLDRYPPVKAFVYTLAGTSAIPLLVFGGFAGATLAGCLAVAGTGVALVQGGFMLFGGFVLFWFLAGSFIFASILTFWFTTAYFSYSVVRSLERSSS